MFLKNAAWFVVRHPATDSRGIWQAIAWAKQAVELAPEQGSCWHTLGVALYRAGDWKAAIKVLEESRALHDEAEFSFDGFFLAMAHWQRGNKDEARKWYDQAVQWMEKNQPQNEELRRFRTEAAELLGIKERLPEQLPGPTEESVGPASANPDQSPKGARP